jgi:hypothetical protein
MDDAAAKVQVFLTGPFRVVSPHGEDIPIRSQKSRGLLALLALAPHGKRTRVWLQDKLWSDRGRDQASASLRQALSQLRVELGPDAGLLQASRDAVSLSLPALSLILDADEDLLEGIDVRDAEFENWLRQERAARSNATQGAMALAHLRRPAGNAQIYLISDAPARSAERLTEDIFLDGVECALRETLSPDVYRRPPPVGTPQAITVSAQVILSRPHTSSLRVVIEQGSGQRVIWTGMRHLTRNGVDGQVDADELLALVHETTEALADSLLLQKLRTHETLDAALLGRFALRKVFMMRPDDVLQGDSLLARAFDMDPHPHFLAWRIQLRVIQVMERHGEADTVLLESMMAQAMLLDPSNSMVLAACANARMLITRDLVASGAHAAASLRINPSNPFAWDCSSINLLLTGQSEAAHTHQMQANAIASRSPIRHFWDMGACLTSVATGRHDMALRMAQSAAALVPSFRPPLRYLTALHAASGEHDRALAAARRLRALEPDFTLDRLRNDPSYPVATLQRSNLLKSDGLRSLLGEKLSA